MGFNIAKREAEKISIYDVDYMVTKPKLKMAREFQKKLKGMEEGDQIPLFVDYLSKIGLPKAVLEEMYLDDFVSLVQHISGESEKK